MLKLGGDLERASGVTGKIQLPDVHGGFKGVHFFSFFFWLHCAACGLRDLSSLTSD